MHRSRATENIGGVWMTRFGDREDETLSDTLLAWQLDGGGGGEGRGARGEGGAAGAASHSARVRVQPGRSHSARLDRIVEEMGLEMATRRAAVGLALALCAAAGASAQEGLPPCASPTDNFAAKLTAAKSVDPLGLTSAYEVDASDGGAQPNAAVRVAEHFEVSDRLPGIGDGGGALCTCSCNDSLTAIECRRR